MKAEPMQPLHSPPTTTILLLEGPLSIAAGLSKRQRLVSDMAQALLKYDAFRNEADAFWTLQNREMWSTYDIIVCIDDARQVAMQEIVAKEMSES